MRIHQLRQRLIGEVRVDSRRAEAQQHGEVVRIAGAGSLNDDVGIAAQALLHEAGLDSPHRHRSRNRQAIFGDVAVREHQQHRAVAHHLLCFITQRAHRVFQRRGVDVKGDIQRVGAVVVLRQGGQLFKVGVEQDR